MGAVPFARGALLATAGGLTSRIGPPSTTTAAGGPALAAPSTRHRNRLREGPGLHEELNVLREKESGTVMFHTALLAAHPCLCS